MDPTFFSVDDVLRFHEICIERDGGLEKVGDLGWLTSAVMMPRPMFASSYRHQVLAAMAAAYLYHLSRSRPFPDSKDELCSRRRSRCCTATASMMSQLHSISAISPSPSPPAN